MCSNPSQKIYYLYGIIVGLLGVIYTRKDYSSPQGMCFKTPKDALKHRQY